MPKVSCSGAVLLALTSFAPSTLFAQAQTLIENDQVRVTRVKMPAHSGVPQHEHTLNRVVVNLSDQDTRMTSSDGKVQESKHKAGDVSVSGPVVHKEENLQDNPFEAIVIELKN